MKSKRYYVEREKTYLPKMQQPSFDQDRQTVLISIKRKCNTN